MTWQEFSSTKWAEANFADAELADKRRAKRLVSVAQKLCETRGGLLARAYGSDWSGLRAAYRLMNCKDAGYERIIAPHLEKTRVECSEPGEYLVIEDTTEADLTSLRAAQDLGWNGNGGGRGFLVHSTLALRVTDWTKEDEPRVEIVGLLGQQCWTRTEKPRKKTEKRAERQKRKRESDRWGKLFEFVQPPSGAEWTFVGDREADIYETFERAIAAGMKLVVRAKQPRALVDQEGVTVLEAAAKAPVKGRFKLELRARPGVAARTATIEVRATTVTLRGPYRPGGSKPPLTLNVIQAREVNAPKGVEPIHWVLLTNHPCKTFQQCRRVVKTYTKRWLIEEYHKALKTGLGMEETQLKTLHRILSLFAVLAVVGTRLVGMKLLAETRPDEPINGRTIDPDVLKILEREYGRPNGGWTHRRFLITVARLGGFLARKGDGMPGWQTLWRGWQTLMIMLRAIDHARRRQKCW